MAKRRRKSKMSTMRHAGKTWACRVSKKKMTCKAAGKTARRHRKHRRSRK